MQYNSLMKILTVESTDKFFLQRKGKWMCFLSVFNSVMRLTWLTPPKSTFTCLRKSLAQSESLPKKAIRILFVIQFTPVRGTYLHSLHNPTITASHCCRDWGILLTTMPEAPPDYTALLLFAYKPSRNISSGKSSDDGCKHRCVAHPPTVSYQKSFLTG